MAYEIAVGMAVRWHHLGTVLGQLLLRPIMDDTLLHITFYLHFGTMLSITRHFSFISQTGIPRGGCLRFIL